MVFRSFCLMLLGGFVLSLVACSVASRGAADDGSGDVVFIRDGQIFVFNLGRKEEKKLVDFGQLEIAPGQTLKGGVAKDVVWSPDSKQVAFSFFPPPQRGVQPGNDLYLVNRDGSGLRLLRKHELPGELLESPYFLPDGSGIVFSRFAPIMKNNQYVGDVLEILRLDLKTNGTKTLATDGLQPSVSPDGKMLTYVGISLKTAAPSVWLANIDGSSAKQIVGEDLFAAIYWPRIAPGNAEVAFAGSAIPSFSVPGRSPGLALPVTVPAERGAAHGLPNDVFKVSVGSTKPVRLAKLDEDDPTPLWSADGKRFVIVGAYALYTMDSDGQNLARVREPGGIGGGDWRGK